MSIRGLVVVVLALVAAPRGARAQYNVPSQATGESRSLVIASDESQQVAVDAPSRPIGWELGASLDFLTADAGALGPNDLRFTDVVLFRVHALVAMGKDLELFAGVDLLPKQPSFTDELVWQGALAGIRRSFGRAASAYVRGQGGPILGRNGTWIIGEAAGQYRSSLAERVLFWESTLGGVYTHLLYDDPAPQRPYWQVELLAQTGIAIREKKGVFATWLNFGFHFPLASHPDPDPGFPRGLDPQVRVGVYLGMLLGVTRSLDLFAEYSILDRGDLGNAPTTLPILSGGFDQRRILFGFNRRFGPRRR